MERPDSLTINGLRETRPIISELQLYEIGVSDGFRIRYIGDGEKNPPIAKPGDPMATDQH